MIPAARSILEDLYRASVAAVEPGAAVRWALAGQPPVTGQKLFIISLGKASQGMARAAVAFAEAQGTRPSGGIVVSGEREAMSVLPAYVGDHPIPGPRSFTAAQALGELTSLVGPDDEVWVFLSGGTSSLIGAPADGMTEQEFVQRSRTLLESGLDIRAMNRGRRQISRWGGGRLAKALAPARVRVFAISDVPGDEFPTIGSGPCSPDPTPAEEIGRVETRIIANNSAAVHAAAELARARGYETIVQEPLTGDATRAGIAIARRLLTARNAKPRCLIWGGETTVRLAESNPRPVDPSPALGGRCQDLALAAAIELAQTQAGSEITLLAAGTDGRDGPTDVAGAIVDGHTVDTIRRLSINPKESLARHNAYPALDAAGSLLRTGPTGTNVMDVVIGIVNSDR